VGIDGYLGKYWGGHKYPRAYRAMGVSPARTIHPTNLQMQTILTEAIGTTRVPIILLKI